MERRKKDKETEGNDDNGDEGWQTNDGTDGEVTGMTENEVEGNSCTGI